MHAGTLLSWADRQVDGVVWHLQRVRAFLGKAFNHAWGAVCRPGDQTWASQEFPPRLDAMESRGWTVPSADLLLLCHATCSGEQPQSNRVAEETRVRHSVSELTCQSCSAMKG